MNRTINLLPKSLHWNITVCDRMAHTKSARHPNITFRNAIEDKHQREVANYKREIDNYKRIIVDAKKEIDHQVAKNDRMWENYCIENNQAGIFFFATTVGCSLVLVATISLCCIKN